jgi:nucleoside-diphosphate-sugar epimerase
VWEDREMARLLVTGGAGFIGKHLIRKLHLAGSDSLAIDNLRRAAKPDFANFLEGDVRDRDFMQSVCRGVDTVFHLAAQSSVLDSLADPEYCFTTNVEGTLVVLEAARRVGVRRFVFTSSREVYGDCEVLPVPEDARLQPKNAYGASKAAAEMYCNTFRDLEVVVLRLSNVYGPGDRDRVVPLFSSSALRNDSLEIFGANKTLDLVWIEDVIDSLWAASQLPIAGATLNIGSGRSIALLDLAGRIISLTGSNSKVVQLPSRGAEVDRYCADISRARTLLDFRPKEHALYGIEQTIKEIEKELALNISSKR